ncbi:MAG: SH3 domain-containing protein [Candidatus Omnitrophica bacterium]|nr:SH3 domain-containing protein [Candidatus Omnitrophota bacterium]
MIGLRHDARGLGAFSPVDRSSLAYAEELPPLPKGPLLLTGCTPEQQRAEYWISRLPNPDRVLKTPEQLKTLNDDIHSIVKECVDIFKLDLVRFGKSIRDQIELEFKTIRGRILFDVTGKRIPKTIFDDEIKPLIQTGNIPAKIKMKWGVATRATSVRALPIDMKMLEEIGDIEFDQLQFTLIKLWTPVGIFHTSKDGQWYYIQAPYVRGWVQSKDIALFAARDEIKKYAKSPKFLVVTGESVSVFSDPALTQILQRPSMGTVIPLIDQTTSAYKVWIPSRKADGQGALFKAYISRKSDVMNQFPAYTQRNVIKQAFKLLGARYGWGGMYNGRDCSGFTHDVFLSMGVDMPRDSDQQIFAGTQLGHYEPFKNSEEKIAALRSATPGFTILKMPMHMMIYLGEINGKFYVIHSTWAERISMTSDEKRRINQVVVSDLSLNGNSYLGSLFDRTVAISEVL